MGPDPDVTTIVTAPAHGTEHGAEHDGGVATLEHAGADDALVQGAGDLVSGTPGFDAVGREVEALISEVESSRSGPLGMISNLFASGQIEELAQDTEALTRRFDELTSDGVISPEDRRIIDQLMAEVRDGGKSIQEMKDTIGSVATYAGIAIAFIGIISALKSGDWGDLINPTQLEGGLLYGGLAMLGLGQSDEITDFVENLPEHMEKLKRLGENPAEVIAESIGSEVSERVTGLRDRFTGGLSDVWQWTKRGFGKVTSVDLNPFN